MARVSGRERRTPFDFRWGHRPPDPTRARSRRRPSQRHLAGVSCLSRDAMSREEYDGVKEARKEVLGHLVRLCDTFGVRRARAFGCRDPGAFFAAPGPRVTYTRTPMGLLCGSVPLRSRVAPGSTRGSTGRGRGPTHRRDATRAPRAAAGDQERRREVTDRQHGHWPAALQRVERRQPSTRCGVPPGLCHGNPAQGEACRRAPCFQRCI